MVTIEVHLKLKEQDYTLIAPAYSVEVEPWGILVYWQDMPIGYRSHKMPIVHERIEKLEIVYK